MKRKRTGAAADYNSRRSLSSPARRTARRVWGGLSSAGGIHAAVEEDDANLEGRKARDQHQHESRVITHVLLQSRQSSSDANYHGQHLQELGEGEMEPWEEG